MHVAFILMMGFGWMDLHESSSSICLVISVKTRLLVENAAMKKIRISSEWAHGIVESHWELAAKCLFFKLDQNSELHIRALRASHLPCDFRTFCRGNSLSDVVSFSHAPPSIDRNLSNNQKFQFNFY